MIIIKSISSPAPSGVDCPFVIKVLVEGNLEVGGSVAVGGCAGALATTTLCTIGYIVLIDLN